MINDAGSHGVVPGKAPGTGTPLGHDMPEAGGLRQGTSVGVDKRERPQSILALFEYAYGESGRKLLLARKDLRSLRVDPLATQAEVDKVRELAADDKFLAVPPSLLATLADLGAEPEVRRRILDLVLVALVSHKVFESRVERLMDPQVQPTLTGHEVSEVAKAMTLESLALKETGEFKEATRERLRVNAVTAFELFRVLRDGRTSRQFVDDMTSLVWNRPIQRNVHRAVAVLAAAKNTEAMSQLSRHFEALLQGSGRETAEARVNAAQQARRAQTAEASSRALAAELEAERVRVDELRSELARTTQRLIAEQDNRVVDTSHLVDDYELLRTRVIRRLTTQIELLSDGLHALRHGSLEVTDEYLDRALSAFRHEVASLKDLDEEQR